MSLNSTSAKKFGSTHVAFGFLIGLVSFDFGLTTVSSCFLIWLETVRDRPNFSHVGKVFAFLFAEVQCGDAARVFDEPDDRKLALLFGFDLQPVLSSLRPILIAGAASIVR
jgi:hypothetical protein